MSDRLPVEVVFLGEPFDRAAVIHTLRHLAMRAGWTLRPKAEKRLIYATTENPREIHAGENDLIVLSSDAVKRHMTAGRDPIPILKLHPDKLPFYHPKAGTECRRGWIAGDVIAGAHALLNLLYERRNRPAKRDGWILFREDWWAKDGFADPEPLADLWLDGIAAEAEKMGWPAGRNIGREAGSAPAAIIATHDVDYLPTDVNHGFPRFLRALIRQLLFRRRAGDAWKIAKKYGKDVFQILPYDGVNTIASKEAAAAARSSFQFTVRKGHRFDPGYELKKLGAGTDLSSLTEKGFEICLHGSYGAGRASGRLASEKAEMESVLGRTVSGHRQHYLNFHPATFFPELEKAGFSYDMSVGYNDRSGPRAGTLFPYRPYDMENGNAFSFWEIPFILMDTTLATTYRFSASQAFVHCMDHIGKVEKAGGCVSIVWHQEQLGGPLDPGFDDVYWDLLREINGRKLRVANGQSIMQEMDNLWNRTTEE
jgi:hypothetical protein